MTTDALPRTLAPRRTVLVDRVRARLRTWGEALRGAHLARTPF